MIVQKWYFGFNRPFLRTESGRLTSRGIFGHVQAWGYTENVENWIFLDPKAIGLRMAVVFRHDDVLAHLASRFDVCDEIIEIENNPVDFTIPVHGPMTCASICGGLVGIRASFPATLRRKLLAKGAKVYHGRHT